jgi:hypothetical protein
MRHLRKTLARLWALVIREPDSWFVRWEHRRED